MNNTLKPAVREICRNPRDAAFLKESHDAAFFEASGPLGSFFEKIMFLDLVWENSTTRF